MQAAFNPNHQAFLDDLARWNREHKAREALAERLNEIARSFRTPTAE